MNIVDTDTQRAIVAEIDAELAPVNANRELIARMEKKIDAELAPVNANRELIARMEKKIGATLAQVWSEATSGPYEQEV